MSDVTELLCKIESGDPAAAEHLLPLVYDELRKLASVRLAQEKPGQTLQATALVHEAYLKLVDVERVQQWKSRGHFFGAAAEAMRRILVDNAKRKRSAKRGGQLERVGLAIRQAGDGSKFVYANCPRRSSTVRDWLEKRWYCVVENYRSR